MNLSETCRRLLPENSHRRQLTQDKGGNILTGGEQGVMHSGLVTHATQRPVMELQATLVLLFSGHIKPDQRGFPAFTINHTRSRRQQRRIDIVLPQDLKDRDVKIRDA